MNEIRSPLRQCLYACALLGMAAPLAAQSPSKLVSHKQALWTRAYVRMPVIGPWTLQAEVEERRYVSPDRDYQHLVPRLTFVREIGSGWAVGVGGAHFLHALPSDESKPVAVNRPEFRPHLDLQSSTRLDQISLSHRYRFEGRFIRKVSGSTLADGYHPSLRARYRFLAKVPMAMIGLGDSSPCLVASEEIFLNLGREIVRNTFDQNRLYVGVVATTWNPIDVEVGVMNIFQEKSEGDRYDSFMLVRMTLYYTIR